MDLRRNIKEYYPVAKYSGFVDKLGTFHAAPTTLYYFSAAPDCSSGIDHFSGGLATDGSGYSFNPIANTVTARDGSVTTLGAASLQDSNGNFLTTTIVSGTTNFTDTTGNTALTATGGAPNPLVYSYPAPSGNATVTFNYTPVTVCTNFNAPSIGEYPATTVYLVSSIQMPDGSAYQMKYEPVPTSPTPPANCAGATTGRVQQITLPTGGTISYAYSGGNNGIYPDGTTAGFTRTENPGGTWTYATTRSPAPYQTVVTDPQNNQTVIDFQVDSATGYYYETLRQVYQGSQATGTLLLSVSTCYNGNTTQSGCPTTAVAAPISQVTRWTGFPDTSRQSRTDTFYNTVSGLVTEMDEYDFGASSPTRKTLIAYAFWDRPSSIKVTDGAGTQQAETDIFYDETPVQASGATQHQIGVSQGNPTTVRSFTAAGTYLTQKTSYYDTGMPYASTDANGAITHYSYGTGSCNFAFPTSIGTQSPAPVLATQQTWDCNGGVKTSFTDQNNQQTNYGYDALWRLTSTSYPDGGQTTITYNDVNQGAWSVGTSSKIDSSRNVSSTAILDGLGHTVQTQLTSDPDGTVYTDTTYDALGRTSSVSNPYRTKSDPTYGVTSYQYDALNRVTQITRPDSSTVLTRYTGGATLVQDEGNGNSRAQRILQSDGLGRLTGVCEVSGATLVGLNPGPTPCQLDITGTGFLTTYQFDLHDNVVSVSQPGLGARTYLFCSVQGSSRPPRESYWRSYCLFL